MEVETMKKGGKVKQKQQKTINALMEHVATLTKQMNEITKNNTK